MLVMSRQLGESVIINDSNFITVVKLMNQKMTVAVLVSRSITDRPDPDSRTVELALDESCKIDDRSDVVLVDLRGDKARLGINAPPEYSVHRLEVYEAILKANRSEDRFRSPEDGLAGSPVPKTPPSRPPSLDVRLNEPPPEIDAG